MTSHLKYTQVELKIDVTVINKELESSSAIRTAFAVQAPTRQIYLAWIHEKKLFWRAEENTEL